MLLVHSSRVMRLSKEVFKCNLSFLSESKFIPTAKSNYSSNENTSCNNINTDEVITFKDLIDTNSFKLSENDTSSSNDTSENFELQPHWTSLERRILNRKTRTKDEIIPGRYNKRESAWDAENV